MRRVWGTNANAALKHLQGLHDQSDHNPHKLEGSYQEMEEERYREVKANRAVTVYHGTTEEVMFKILENGIKPSSGFGNFMQGNMESPVEIYHSDYVHVAQERDVALRYAVRVSELLEERSRRSGSQQPKSYPVIFEAKVPAGAQVRPDNYDTDGLLIKGKIKPEWITRYWIVGNRKPLVRPTDRRDRDRYENKRRYYGQHWEDWNIEEVVNDPRIYKSLVANGLVYIPVVIVPDAGLRKHLGPGNHPDGSSQLVHAGGEAAPLLPAGTALPQFPPLPSTEAQTDYVKDVARKMGWAAVRVEVDPNPRYFQMGGKVYSEAGNYDPDTDWITFRDLNQAQSREEVDGMVAHEFVHRAWAHAMKQYGHEKELAQLNGDMTYTVEKIPGGMRVGAFHLKPEAEPRYPVLSSLSRFLSGPMADRLKKKDGVTPYSREHWKYSNPELAMNETLAEIAALSTQGKYMTVPSEWRALERAVIHAEHARYRGSVPPKRAKAVKAEPVPMDMGNGLVEIHYPDGRVVIARPVRGAQKSVWGVSFEVVLRKSYPAPHCGKPGGGSAPRSECAGEEEPPAPEGKDTYAPWELSLDQFMEAYTPHRISIRGSWKPEQLEALQRAGYKVYVDPNNMFTTRYAEGFAPTAMHPDYEDVLPYGALRGAQVKEVRKLPRTRPSKHGVQPDWTDKKSFYEWIKAHHEAK